MASEVPVQSPPTAAEAAQLVSERSHQVHNALNTTKTDSDAAPLEKERPATSAGEPEAAKPASETNPPVAEAKKEDPQTGEKRDIDSTAAPDAEDKDKSASEKPVESDAKKQKTDEPAKEANGTAPAAADTTNGQPKKAGRPKKDKVKDAVKKVVPTDSIGSRTRSRTKATT
ncbi:hypothetical protein NUU61_004783 [Penicillium alfredii]|uniref:Uncharacterized protein n=1 Tax=Penicillium alfredii TaxID=1506179 RepID=A0A9W9F8A2_9EURO|nr:uncharacterized protein NUU61_004783 [Penicillium alfredii]KAJ5095427.1 hypothetical protein NUU61_004783 [Penicillium alfredii]